jgi:AcrR family transcriptional regulator
MQENIRSSIKNPDLLAERRKQIVVAATKLFLKQGFEGTSVEEIAKTVGVTVAALYRYIGKKDDIRWLATETSDLYQNGLFVKIREHVKNLKYVDALVKSITLYYRSVDETQDVYNFINHIVLTSSKELRQSVFDREKLIIAYFEQLLKEGINAGEFEVEDTFLTAHNIVAAANMWANRRWLLRSRYTLEDYIRKETDSILNDVLPKNTPIARTGTMGNINTESKGECKQSATVI